MEAEAVERILDRVDMKEWKWIGSEVMSFEISKTPDPERRQRLFQLEECITESIALSELEESRAAVLESLGFAGMDALHLACAETGKVDVFLTTDDRLLRLAKRLGGRLKVPVENPVSWLLGMELPWLH
jgi:predicted nucleic acid-binding protein